MRNFGWIRAEQQKERWSGDGAVHFAVLIIAVILQSCASVVSQPLTARGADLYEAESTTRLARELMLHRPPSQACEVAAFVVRESSGVVGLRKWPLAGCREAHWLGPVPDDAIAVLHTHPVREPRPSLLDMEEAVRTAMPFVSVTPVELCMADVNGVVACRDLAATPRALTTISDGTLHARPDRGKGVEASRRAVGTSQ